MRRPLDLALTGLLVVLAAVGALRWLDVAAYPVVVLQEGGPFVVLGLVLLTLVAALLRRWWVLVASAAVSAVALGIAVPAFFSTAQPSHQAALTVMVANLDAGRADAPELMDAVRARGVNVLVLLEATPESLDALRERGLDREFTSSAGRPVSGSRRGAMVYSRFPLKETVDKASAAPQPLVSVQVDGVAVTVKAVHVPDPAVGVGSWREGLGALAAWERAGVGPAVLAGGFDADWGHPAFRALTDGFEEAQRTAGLGWVRTFPMDGHRLPPYVQPEHLLSRDLTVVRAGQVAIHGTDHALVWASYALTRGG